MTISIRTQNPSLSPEIRVYGPGAVGVLAAGSAQLSTTLATAGTYVIGVFNANGQGGPEFTYDLTATFQ